jgi:hypothetical protein
LSNIDTIIREVEGAGVELVDGGLKGRRNPIDGTGRWIISEGLSEISFQCRLLSGGMTSFCESWCI